MVVAVGLVALAAVLKGIMNRPAPAEPGGEVPPSTEAALPAGTDLQMNSGSSNTVAGIEQAQADELERELKEIGDLSLAGAGDPYAAGLLVGKLTHREREVREAALSALIHLNDTNVIPSMEQTVGAIEDPREKVALMDAIAYLKLPEEVEMPPAASADATAAMPVPSTVRPKGETGKAKAKSLVKRSPRRDPSKARRSAIPPAATDPQPVSPGPAPVPDAAPPPQ